jgi:hypothetical protein
MHGAIGPAIVLTEDGVEPVTLAIHPDVVNAHPETQAFVARSYVVCAVCAREVEREDSEGWTFPPEMTSIAVCPQCWRDRREDDGEGGYRFH